MSAVGRGVGNSGMPAMYLLTLVYQLSWTLEWLPKAKKIPPGPELSAHQVDVIKVSRITKSLFNRSKEFPEVLGSTYHLQGNCCVFCPLPWLHGSLSFIIPPAASVFPAC